MDHIDPLISSTKIAEDSVARARALGLIWPSGSAELSLYAELTRDQRKAVSVRVLEKAWEVVKSGGFETRGEWGAEAGPRVDDVELWRFPTSMPAMEKLEMAGALMEMGAFSRRPQSGLLSFFAGDFVAIAEMATKKEQWAMGRKVEGSDDWKVKCRDLASRCAQAKVFEGGKFSPSPKWISRHASLDLKNPVDAMGISLADGLWSLGMPTLAEARSGQMAPRPGLDERVAYPFWGDAKAARESVLLSCALDGDAEGVERALAAGAGQDALDNRGHCALMRAASNGHEDCVALLLKHGFDPKRVIDNGIGAATCAVSAGRAGILTMLLDAGADVEGRDTFGDTLLMEAIAFGQLECVEILIARGADVGDPAIDRVPKSGSARASQERFESCKTRVLSHRAHLERVELEKSADSGLVTKRGSRRV